MNDFEWFVATIWLVVVAMFWLFTTKRIVPEAKIARRGKGRRMKLVVLIEVDEDHIPEELNERHVHDWSTPDIALLLMDGDGGYHWVEGVAQVHNPEAEEIR